MPPHAVHLDRQLLTHQWLHVLCLCLRAPLAAEAAGSVPGAGGNCSGVKSLRSNPGPRQDGGLVGRCSHFCPLGGAALKGVLRGTEPQLPQWLWFINLQVTSSWSRMHSLTGLPGITCKINHLCPNPCFQGCFGGELKPRQRETYSLKVTQRHITRLQSAWYYQILFGSRF